MPFYCLKEMRKNIPSEPKNEPPRKMPAESINIDKQFFFSAGKFAKNR